MQNEKVLRQLLDWLCRRLRESRMMVKVLSFADAEQRVRARLKILSSQYGERIRGNDYYFKAYLPGYCKLLLCLQGDSCVSSDRFIKEGEAKIYLSSLLAMKKLHFCDIYHFNSSCLVAI